MLKRNLVLAVRIFFKYPLSSAITLGGLSLGIGCFLLLFTYVYNEYQTDRFHKNYNDLYHVTMAYYVDGDRMFTIPPPAGLFNDLASIPSINSGTRVFSPNDIVVEYQDSRFLEDGLVMVDSSWLSMFDFVYENENFSLFKDPTKIIVSSAIAKKLFGLVDPIGKEVKVKGESYIVENVLLTEGYNTSMNIHLILPFSNRIKEGVEIDSYKTGHTPYFLLSDQSTSQEIEQNVQQLIDENIEDGFDVRIEVSTLKDSYFQGSSNLKWQNGNIRGNKKYYQIFSVVGILILIMAIINYVNLVTARASMRSKEVGIKKTIGAQKSGLLGQFISESFLITLLSGVLAIGLAELALTNFNTLLVRPVDSNFLLSFEFLILYVIGLGTVSILAGVYPAFVLSSFKPIGALKQVKLTSKSWLRNALVTLQFAVTSLLIFGALVIFKQVSFLSTLDLGFDVDQIVSVKASEEIKKHISVVKNDLQNVPGVEFVSVGNLPGIGWMYSGNFGGKSTNVAVQHVDEDFINMAGLAIVEGRSLKAEDEGTENMMINMTLRNLIFGDNATVFGKMPDSERFLVGVVDDFQFSSVKNNVMPLEMKVGGMEFRDVLLRLDKNTDASEAMVAIKKVMLLHDPETVFEYSFLDADYNNQFKSEQLFLVLLKAFTILSIIIGGLGLFGLAQFNFAKNIKTIGIKKMLGAPQMAVVTGLLKGIFSPIAIGLLLALPLGYYLMSDWLMDYPNRITLSWPIVIMTVFLVMLITLLTVLYQILNTVGLKPVDTLKNE